MDATLRRLTRRCAGDPARADQGPRRDVQSGEPLSPRRARGGRRRLGAAGRRRTTRRRAAAADDRSVTIQRARTIIARNDSPDIPFTQSINPYQGCEHGCIYCYARPTHAYLDLSPGLDFETKLFAKPERRGAAARRSSRSPATSATRSRSAPTPIRTSRSSANGRSRAQILEVLAACEHPLTIVTKSALVERDIDLLAPMAREEHRRASTSRSRRSTASLRASSSRAPRRRTRRLQRDARARRRGHAGRRDDVAPIIPQLTDHDLEAILEAAAQRTARATPAGSMLRLPLEVAPLFRDWLDAHYPLRAAHVMSIVQQIARRSRQRPALRLAHARRRASSPTLIAQALRDRVREARAQPRARP